MQITIHKGTREIGGTVIELATTNTKILLDVGLPLASSSKPVDISTIKPDAILISHPHQDHYGLIDTIDPAIPIHMGKIGLELITATRKFLQKPLPNNTFEHFDKWQPFKIGDFTITPYLVDHSTVDAYAFLIEAEGKRVLYSGDFRATGNKRYLFDRLIQDIPNDIDVLLMEGTMMRRNNSKFPNETSVQKRIEEVLETQQNISFLISSSQNIDRLVAAAHACMNTGKLFVIDIYTAWVLEIIKKISEKTPRMSWKQVRVYADYWPDAIVKNDRKHFGPSFRNNLYGHRVTKEQIQESPSDYLYLSKVSPKKSDIMQKYMKYGKINIIYSQWLGYLDYTNEELKGAENIAALRDDEQRVNFVYAHTSGHATPDVLQRLVYKTKPAKLVPIHTEYPGDFNELFENVFLPGDGEAFII